MKPAVIFNQAEADAVLWAALGKVAAKEARRDLLREECSYPVNVIVTGRVVDVDVRKSIRADLTVGSEQTRASSRGPDNTHLLACILGKLNQKTREKLCRDLPEDFLKAGESLPDVELSLHAMAKSLLSRLRSKQSTTVAGSVSCRYQLD